MNVTIDFDRTIRCHGCRSDMRLVAVTSHRNEFVTSGHYGAEVERVMTPPDDKIYLMFRCRCGLRKSELLT